MRYHSRHVSFSHSLIPLTGCDLTANDTATRHSISQTLRSGVVLIDRQDIELSQREEDLILYTRYVALSGQGQFSLCHIAVWEGDMRRMYTLICHSIDVLVSSLGLYGLAFGKPGTVASGASSVPWNY